MKESVLTTEARWTLLGFTAARGIPVMCALIFACKKMNFYSQKGIDVRYPKTEKNLYNKKQFPGGPTCSNRRLMLELSYLSKKNRE